MILWLSKLSDTEKWAFGLLALLFIGIAIQLISHTLSIQRDRQTRRAKACADFYAAVHEALSGLYPIPSNWPSDKLAIISILEGKFPLLQAAIAKFRPNIPIYKRWLFDRAWRIYRLGADGRDIDGHDYWQYVPHSGEGIENGRRYKHDNTLTYKDNFKKNVDRFLSYANST